MYIHDIIKIMYTNIGYLPNYPYELISDDEMFAAFTREKGFFDGYYPCPSESLQEAYNLLKNDIFERISKYQTDGEELPSWVYSYMIMRPITFDSDEANIAYLYELTGLESATVWTEFTPELAQACYEASCTWLKKLPSRYSDRYPTMFGETHVTKSLRLNQANILMDSGGI